MPQSKKRFLKGSLAGVRLFDGLDAEQRFALEQLCSWQQVDDRTEVLRHKDNTSDVVFLISGRARAIAYSAEGKQVAFREINSGEMFGELAAIDGGPRSASVMTVGPGVVATMAAAEFRKMIDREPIVRENLLRYLVEMVRGLSGRVFELSTLLVRPRTFTDLIRLAEKIPVIDGWACLDPAPIIEDIANRIGARREGVNRVISELIKDGILRRRGKALLIDLDALRRRLGEAAGE